VQSIADTVAVMYLGQIVELRADRRIQAADQAPVLAGAVCRDAAYRAGRRPTDRIGGRCAQSDRATIRLPLSYKVPVQAERLRDRRADAASHR
jgi:ABC-type dipeptide/oligopeptide/nickel transport system ATPase component